MVMVTQSSDLPTAQNGIIKKLSRYSVDETFERPEGILRTKGLTRFALVDHSGEAEKAGMKCAPPSY
jgi:uncharacterized protein (DUF302 family)